MGRERPVTGLFPEAHHSRRHQTSFCSGESGEASLVNSHGPFPPDLMTPKMPPLLG